MDVAQIKAFVLAGRAVFTLKSLKTGKHFTFRVAASRKAIGVHRVYVLGNNNFWSSDGN